MKKIYLFFTCLILGTQAFAQQLPVYSQYFINPYLYNPALAGDQGSAAFYLTHRQQWRGIPGAPVTSTFSFHAPVGKRAALGLNVFNDKRGLLSTTSALVSYGYTVPFAERHFIRFGLSAGMGTNSIDMEQLDESNDPAVINLISDNIFLDGQFGINYQLNGLSLGFSLPKLYEPNVFSDTYFSDFEISRFKRYLFTAGYKFNINNDAAVLEPLMLYRINEGMPSVLEGGAVLHLRDMVWMGASYRQNYGFTGVAGINLKDYLSIGYAYEYATDQTVAFADGTHEIQIGLRLGKKREIKKKPSISRPGPSPTPAKEPVPAEVEKPETEAKEQTETETAKTEAPGEIIEKTVTKGQDPLEMGAGNYVVVGVFGNEANAIKFTRTLKGKGVDASYGYNSENNYYYVYPHKSQDKQSARVERARFRKIPEFKDTWMLTVEEAPQNAAGATNQAGRKSPDAGNADSFANTPVLNEQAVNFVFDYDNIITISKGEKADELQKGNYVVVAVFSDKENARKFIDGNYNKDLPAETGYNSKTNYHYIYLFKSDDIDAAIRKRDGFRQSREFSEAWILNIE